MLVRKNSVIGFIAAFSLTTLGFVGAYLASTPVQADLPPCPAVPPGAPFSGTVGWICAGSGTFCQLRAACNLPPVPGGDPDDRYGYSSCAQFGSSCIMGYQCRARCQN